jgi:hypothetical protein
VCQYHYLAAEVVVLVDQQAMVSLQQVFLVVQVAGV